MFGFVRGSGRSSIVAQPERWASGRPGAPSRAFVVARRVPDAPDLPEVYAVTATTVQRLLSERRFGARGLDWVSADAARLELGHLVLARVAGQTPSRALVARFAQDVLSGLPDDGFVLEPSVVWRWVREAAGPEDFSPAPAGRGGPWIGALRRMFGVRSPSPRAAAAGWYLGCL